MTNKYLMLLAMTAIVVVIGWLDYATGPDYGMSLFYLGPVAITAWYCGIGAGMVLAAAAATLWYVSDVTTHMGVTYFVSLWNGFTRLVIYVSTAVLLALLRADRARLRELLKTAESNARTDSLTGLANSRAFYERLEQETKRRERDAVTIAYIDVDNFKRVNDRYGHSKGDDVLKEVADALRAIIRGGDLAARIGGDEFAIAMWATTTEASASAFEHRLANALAPVIEKYPNTGLDASVGFATLQADANVDAVLRAADEAMYAAKAARKAGT